MGEGGDRVGDGRSGPSSDVSKVLDEKKIVDRNDPYL